MYITRIVSFSLLSCCFIGSVAAQTCPPNTQVNTPRTLLSGKTACANTSNDRWQEFHDTNGNLIDFKKGDGLPSVDPRKQVGTWSATDAVSGNNGNCNSNSNSNSNRNCNAGLNASVTYNYGTGGTYTYLVCAVPTLAAPTSYTFVGATTIPGAKVLSGPVQCP